MSHLDTLADSFEQILMSPDGWPVSVVAQVSCPKTFLHWPDFPAAATLAHNRMGHGSGLTRAEALRRATGELIEIASCCSWGDEDLIWATPAEVVGAAWTPEDLDGFSADQRNDRETWNERLAGLDWIPPPLPDRQPIPWLSATSMTGGERILVPAESVLLGMREAGDACAYAVADTSGCAAGETRADATLRALLEAVERDATGRWWYGQRRAPALDPSMTTLGIDAAACLASRGRRLLLLDLSFGFAFPTVAALACDVGGGALSAGFATRVRLRDAIEAALRELMMMDLRDAVLRPSGERRIEVPWCFLDQQPAWEPSVVDPETESQTADALLHTCVDALTAQGCRLAVLDMTRDCLGVPVVKVVSPDLCHWKPRLERPRLHAASSGDPAEPARGCEGLNPQLLAQ